MVPPGCPGIWTVLESAPVKRMRPPLMKFSIVTPNYNYGRFLGKALESVFVQTEGEGAPEIEHIVIDGGSTDDSVQILERWDSFVRGTVAAKESRYSFRYVSEPDEGQTDAINKGLRRATGDIVAWLNADEWYLPGKLALVAAAFARRPDTDFLYGEPLFVDKDGKPIRVKRDHPFSRFVLLRYGCHIASCAAFWRRRIQTECGHWLDPSFKVTMDYDFYCRICRAGCRFRFLPATLAAFTWHEDNVSSIYDDVRLSEEMRVWEMLYPHSFHGGFRQRFLAPLLRWFAHQSHRGLVLYRLARFPHGR